MSSTPPITPNEIESILRRELLHIGCEFKPNTLAYLALTSKSEQEMCALLANRLNSSFPDHLSIQVGREKSIQRKRIDVAVLCREEPLALIEAKSAYVFDLVASEDPYPSAGMRKDIDRLRSIDFDGGRFSLVFFTHLNEEPSEEFKCVLKYARDIKKYFQKISDEGTDVPLKIVEGFRNLDKAVGSLRVVTNGKIDAGCAFGVKVSLLYRMYDASA